MTICNALCKCGRPCVENKRSCASCLLSARNRWRKRVGIPLDAPFRPFTGRPHKIRSDSYCNQTHCRKGHDLEGNRVYTARSQGGPPQINCGICNQERWRIWFERKGIYNSSPRENLLVGTHGMISLDRANENGSFMHEFIESESLSPLEELMQKEEALA